MSIFVCLYVLIFAVCVLASTSVNSQQLICPNYCSPSTNYIWQYQGGLLTWDQAFDFCTSQNGRLAGVNSSDDRLAMRSLITTSDHVWVALKNVGPSNNQVFWYSSKTQQTSPYSCSSWCSPGFINLNSGNPGCIHYHVQDDFLHDQGCSANWTYICEVPPSLNCSRYVVSNGTVKDCCGEMSYVFCDNGYYLSNTSINPRLCTHNSSGDVWKSPPQTCFPFCRPLNVSNGFAISTGNTTGMISKIHCNTNFTAVGGTTVVTCQSNGKWKPITATSVATCKPNCHPLFVPNGFVLSTAANTPGSVSNISCNANFSAFGTTNITCQYNGQWTAPPATCIPNCPLILAPTNGTVIFSRSDLVIGTNAKFSCDPKYYLNGSSSLNCIFTNNTNGSIWNDKVPTCKLIPSKTIHDPMNSAERTVSTVAQVLGCTALLLMLALTFIFFAILRVRSLERMLQACQEITLFMAHLIVMTLRYETDKTLCIGISIVLQYLFLTNFAFLALEALQTYCIIQNVLSIGGFVSWKGYLLIGWGTPLAIVAIFAPFFCQDYISEYSCWLSFNKHVAVVTILPIAAATSVAAVLTEAATMRNKNPLPSTPLEKYEAAMIGQKNATVKIALNLLSYFLGAWAVYQQHVALFTTVSGLNVGLGLDIFISHISTNAEVLQYVRRKFCLHGEKNGVP